MTERTWQYDFRVSDEEKKKRIRLLKQQYPKNLTLFERPGRTMLVYIKGIPWSLDDTANGIGKVIGWIENGTGEKPFFFI